jgi:DNA-binding transcriptional MerR regulator
MEDLLPIGSFARRCGLSRSALRFYDQCGLLRPATVDDSSGYRYYAAAQLAEALLVRRLRAAALPVGDARRYLDGTEAERRQILDAHTSELEQRMAEAREAVGELREELDRGTDAITAGWCEVPAHALAHGLAQVGFAETRDPERPELAGIWIETREESLRLVATDSYRMAVRDLIPDAELGSEPIRGVIAHERIGELHALLARHGVAALRQRSDGTLEAALGGATMTIGAHSDAVPDYEQLLSSLPAGHHGIVGRREFADALIACAAHAAGVELRFRPDTMTLIGGERQIAIAAAWDGPDLAVAVDARFLTEAVEVMVGPDVIVEAFDALKPVTVRCADTGTLSVLTMPIRLDA